MIYVFFAEGYEETEAIGAIDVFKRAGLETKLVGTYEKLVKGAHGINIEMDILLKDIPQINKDDILFLPGGIPGVHNLEKSAELKEIFVKAHSNKNLIAAICAAPSVLYNWGIIRNGDISIYPSCENLMPGCKPTGKAVTTQENVVMGKGVGVVFEFALEIVKILEGETKAREIKEEIVLD